MREPKEKMTTVNELRAVAESQVLRRKWEQWVKEPGSASFTTWVREKMSDGKIKADFLHGNRYFVYRIVDPDDGSPMGVSVGLEGEKIDLFAVWHNGHRARLKEIIGLGKEPRVEIIKDKLDYFRALELKKFKFRQTFNRDAEDDDGE